VRLRTIRAIVEARVHAERRTLIYACAAAAVVGFIQPRGLAAPIFFSSVIGIVVALVQGPGRYPHLDLCEQSAPLFGRELARAKALVPCIVATLATATFCAAAFVGGGSDIPAAFLIALAAVIPSTLTALSATIRSGSSRLLYVALACAISVVAFLLAVLAGSLPAELAFAAFVSFFALRQYGEALARYDPV
jgi:hypothetical protein